MPNCSQIIKDEGVEGKPTDKVIVITGASSGIGVESSATGPLFSSPLATWRKRTRTKTGSWSLTVSLVHLDLDSFKSIRTGAKQILSASQEQVNLLINSAGVMGISGRKLTEDGIEAHFSGNYGFFFLSSS